LLVVFVDKLKTRLVSLGSTLYRPIASVALVLWGIALTLGNAYLLIKGVVAPDTPLPLLLIASGIQIFRKSRSGLQIFVAYFTLTWLAAIFEIGLDGWSLLPRVDLACIAFLCLSAPFLKKQLAPNRLSEWWQELPSFRQLVVPALLGLLALSVLTTNLVSPRPSEAAPRIQVAGVSDWPTFGGSSAADKFSGLSEITPENAGKLVKIWEFTEPSLGAFGAAPPRKDEVTPLQIKDKLFICQPDNVILALDAESGKLSWRYDPKTNLEGTGANICRGLAYVEVPKSGTCPHRLLMGTMDARLIAVNSETGIPCSDFGKGGQVDLTRGLGDVKKGFYYVTSPPTVANGVAVIGALVRDNHEVGEPSGVVRGFDAETGHLKWAWDMGRKAPPTSPLRPGEIYTRGTPNAWSIFSADPNLGLVFLPMGNATPDFVGQHRKAEWSPYSSALVALDIATGRPRWSFQTVHHDLWDYDLSAQPILADMPFKGTTKPAVIIATKRGDIFILDRQTGKPLSAVSEQLTPATDVPGEWTSKTQPFPAKMPRLGGSRLTDVDMWGLTPFDRLFCRVTLQHLRYDGDFTPPSLKGSLIYPGMAGGVDWGGFSVDPGRHLLIIPTLHIADRLRLVPRTDLRNDGENPQLGTPYSADLNYFVTRLGIPCQRPPYAELTAINLANERIVWRRPLGTAERVGPLGIASHLPFTLGAPPIVGGVITTAADVTFIGAVGDRRLRALNSLTGKQIWSTRLPAGNQATPITYRAPRSGRQMVVIVSGGWADLGKSQRVSTHVIAFALPK
jgi:membrane-bound PQQ-dependent dehydrogenase (glucose/quinate/shikimate family)